jgi:hypothetical protein
LEEEEELGGFRESINQDDLREASVQHSLSLAAAILLVAAEDGAFDPKAVRVATAAALAFEPEEDDEENLCMSSLRHVRMQLRTDCCMEIST